MRTLRAKARANRETDQGLLQRWWSKKYGLPINDDLYTQRNAADLIVELFEDLHDRRDDILEHLRLGTGGERADLEDQLAAINTALDLADQKTSTDLWLEEVEAALAEGELPDL